MRLKREQITCLKEEIDRIVRNAKVYLFGSRVDDDAKGGDIDILVLTDSKLSKIDISKIRVRFQNQCGLQKLDLINYTKSSISPFKNLILNDSIEL